jgi:hypothetical protein
VVNDIRPGLVTLGAIAGWIALWCICGAGGLEAGKRMVVVPFILSGAVVGFAVTLWPVITWVVPLP